MSVVTFSYTSQDLINNQPAATDYVYARSTDASDTTQTCTVYDASTNHALSLDGKLEQETTTTMATLRWVILSATATGTVNVYSEDNAVAASGDIRIDSQPDDTDTVFVGLAGNGTTYTFNTSIGGANSVLIGSDVNETADNLASAINDTSTGTSTPVDGTDWGTGTTANGYVSATVSAGVVTVTDKLKCNRSLAWAIAEGTAAHLTIRQPIGGKDGTLLTSVDPGDTEHYDGDIELDTEDLATSTLPGTKTGATDAISIGGKLVTLDIGCENVTSAIVMKYEVSNDNSNWEDGQDAITNADNNRIWYNPSEHVQYIRLNITSNPNATASALNCKVIY